MGEETGGPRARKTARLRARARSVGMVLQPDKLRPEYLGGYGFAPEVVFDVGVNRGTPWLYATYPDARLVLIDPQPGSRERVEKAGVPPGYAFHDVALGEAPGRAVLQVPQAEGGTIPAMASLRTRQDSLARRIETVREHEVAVERLDDLARAHPGRALLKIDTEGFEAEVLRGAPEVLARCEAVILELSVTERFDGVAPPSAAIGPLTAAGLELRDVLSLGAGPGPRARPRHVDLLFARWGAR